MKFRSNKAFLLYYSLSMITFVVGYFLWTILIPIQDINLMDKQQISIIQKELALNYGLGKLLLYIGFLVSFLQQLVY